LRNILLWFWAAHSAGQEHHTRNPVQRRRETEEACRQFTSAGLLPIVIRCPANFFFKTQAQRRGGHISVIGGNRTFETAKEKVPRWGRSCTSMGCIPPSPPHLRESATYVWDPTRSHNSKQQRLASKQTANIHRRCCPGQGKSADGRWQSSLSLTETFWGVSVPSSIPPASSRQGFMGAAGGSVKANSC